jgi:hypothetical protein
VEEWRKTIREQNDGTQAAEPGQRCSQTIFEAWMKKKCLSKPLIDGRFGWKFQTLVEDDTGVTSTFVDLEGKGHVVRSRYLIGCDGGGSRVRRFAGIKMIGGYMCVSPYTLSSTYIPNAKKSICNVSRAFQVKRAVKAKSVWSILAYFPADARLLDRSR